jgi:hypothetical protein
MPRGEQPRIGEDVRRSLDAGAAAQHAADGRVAEGEAADGGDENDRNQRRADTTCPREHEADGDHEKGEVRGERYVGGAEPPRRNLRTSRPENLFSRRGHEAGVLSAAGLCAHRRDVERAFQHALPTRADYLPGQLGIRKATQDGEGWLDAGSERRGVRLAAG